jgi:Uma2 family endonuclease
MIRVTTKPLPGTVYDPLYPSSDGRPMGESDFHGFAMFSLREALQDFFEDQPDVYVASNILFYYEQGNPSGRRDPDILFARGVRGKHLRQSYRLWEEGVLPRVFFEIASENTWRVDVGEKRELYARLGIAEYFIFDPAGLYLDPVLQGFRLENGIYVPLTPAADGSLLSRELGLRLRPEGAMLRLIDVRTGQPVPTRREQAEQALQQAQQERQRAEQATQLAEQEKQRAEESAQLAAQEKQRAEESAQLAAQEKQRSEQAVQQAEQEKQRADELAVEVERLRAQLAQRKPPKE